MKKTILLIVALAVTLLLCSQHTRDNPTDTGGNNWHTPVITSINATIGISGGTLSVDDTNSPLFGTSVTIPKGALTKDTKITIALDSNFMHDSGASLVTFVRLLPDSLFFDPPIQITLPISSAYSPTDTIGAFYYTSNDNMWVQVYDNGDSVLANGKRVVKALSNHFCEWMTKKADFTFDSKIFAVSSTKSAVKITLNNPCNSLFICNFPLCLSGGNIEWMLDSYNFLCMYWDVRLMSNRTLWPDEVVHEWTFIWQVKTEFYMGDRLYDVGLFEGSNIQNPIYTATGLTFDSLCYYLQNEPQILYCDNSLTTSTEGFHTDVYLAVSTSNTISNADFSNGYRIRDKRDYFPTDLNTYANSTDPLLQDLNYNGIVEQFDPSVKSISIAATQLTLFIGAADVTVPIIWTPPNATDKAYYLSTSNSAVVSVVNNMLHAVSPGNATGTVISDDGGQSATVDITVAQLAQSLSASDIVMLVTGPDTNPQLSWFPPNATNQNFTMSSSNTNVTTIVNNKIHPVGSGTSVITVTSVGNSSITTTFNVTVNQLVSITSGPQSQTITAGQTVTFSVTATGTAPLSYQWYYNGTAISGATSSSYTISNAQVANAGTYTVTVSNGILPNATSSGAVLTVNAAPVAPSITVQPQSQTITAGQTVTFSVTATGTAPLSYQWYVGGIAISGATSSSYSISNVQAANAGNYTVTVSNGTLPNAISAGAVLTVNAAAPVAPSITVQPQSQTITAGQTVTFSVTATGTAPLSYQWCYSTTAAGAYTAISGATSSSYTISNVQASNAGAYIVVVSNFTYTYVPSNAAMLTVNAGATVAPSITVQPQSQTVTAGQTATLSVTATGTAPLSYQWYYNGTAISGATSSSYSISNVQAANAGTYTVTVSNGILPNATSNGAVLTVSAATSAPTITMQPLSQIVASGQNVTFSVTATGTAPLSYQWYVGGTAILGATSSSYSISNVQASNAGTYTVVVTNSPGNVTSDGAILTVTNQVINIVYSAINTDPPSIATIGTVYQYQIFVNREQNITSPVYLGLQVSGIGTLPLQFIGASAPVIITIPAGQGAYETSNQIWFKDLGGACPKANGQTITFTFYDTDMKTMVVNNSFSVVLQCP